MPFKIIRNDITKMQVDAIVNTANEAPAYSTGVDKAVYTAAGVEELLAEREKIGWMKEGEVAITPGFHLPARYIIHAVSPIYIDGESGEEDKLRSCYQKSLELANEFNCESIAFPLISTGNFGYPKEEGMRIAVDEINAFLMKNQMLVYLVVFDETATKLGQSLYPDLKSYIDKRYIRDKAEEEYRFFEEEDYFDEGYQDFDTKASIDGDLVGGTMSLAAPAKCLAPSSYEEADEALDESYLFGEGYEEFYKESRKALKERLKHLSDTFQEYLFFLMELKGLSSADVYKRAIISKQTFSKIKNNPNYHPDKATAMRLCVGAKLNLDETRDLLSRAGYALSPCEMRDIIFQYFIESGVYDMIEIDCVLEQYDLPCFIE